MIRKTMLMLGTFFSASTSLHADIITNANALLEVWSPITIEATNDGTLKVRLPQRRITEQIYSATILYGICFSEARSLPLDGISEVQIFNKFGVQGYVFEGGTEFCNEISTSSNQNVALLGVTHLY